MEYTQIVFLTSVLIIPTPTRKIIITNTTFVATIEHDSTTDFTTMFSQAKKLRPKITIFITRFS